MLSAWGLVDINNWVSDVMLAFCLFFWASRLKNLVSLDALTRTWAKFFILIGVAAFIGGWGHMLVPHLGQKGVLVSWEFSILAILSLEMGLIIKEHTPQYIQYLLILKAFLFGICTLYFMDFMWVKIDMTLGIVGLIIPSLIQYYRQTGNNGFLIMVVGMLANGFSGAIHSLNISLNQYCDHRDLAHFVSILCFGIVFYGLKKLALDEEAEVSLEPFQN